MKVWIKADERYPVYSVREEGGYEVEAMDAQVARWEAAADAFSEAQDEMDDLYEAAEQAALAEKERERLEREAVEKAKRQQVEKEREAIRRANDRKYAAMMSKLEANGGVVYDADGEPIATVTEFAGGFRLKPGS